MPAFNATEVKPGRAIAAVKQTKGGQQSDKPLAFRVTRVFEPFHPTEYEDRMRNCGVTYAWMSFAITPAQLKCDDMWGFYAGNNDRRNDAK